MDGAIECVAKLWRRGGRWVMELAMPEWVEAEVLADLKNPKRSVVLFRENGSLPLGVLSVPTTGAASVGGGATAPSTEARLPPWGGPGFANTNSGMTEDHPLPIPKPSSLSRPMQILPVGIDRIEDGRQYILEQYPRHTILDRNILRQLTGLVGPELDRLICRVLNETNDKYLTDPVARSMVEAQRAAHPIASIHGETLPRLTEEEARASVMRRGGRPKGLKHTPETLAKISETKRENRATREAANPTVSPVRVNPDGTPSKRGSHLLGKKQDPAVTAKRIATLKANKLAAKAQEAQQSNDV